MTFSANPCLTSKQTEIPKNVHEVKQDIEISKVSQGKASD